MGTISERRRQDGSAVYTAQVRVMRDGKSVSTSSSFDRRSAAEAWLRRKEAELLRPNGFEKLSRTKRNTATLADAIDKYLAQSEQQIGRTKAQVLDAIKRYAIADMICEDIHSKDIVEFAQELLAGGRQPQTVANYLSHLSAIFQIAGPAWKMPLDPNEMKAAMIVSKRLGMTQKSAKRDRRPTIAEMDALMQHFAERSKRANAMPMHRICAFALFSTRRQDEITRIKWEHLEPGRILVEDMKHPGQKWGNDVWVDLPPEAEAIIRSMPQTAAQIFPYKATAITAAFTRACKFLGIEDLHFHDLRHEGVSRQFEMGKTIPQAASVSGHRSWSSLQRYAHLRQTGDRWAAWKWTQNTAAPS
ncbi:tyrosine-type recombinase/integrase [Thioclava sp. GXIMD4215]|uniref:tyrosine-type recombinase/integrase n=1 Tax=Thioclava sp. GXIMD4215 TaxID=3131928 RepID=UPI00324A44E5